MITKTKKFRGFSLVEMLIVLTIVGILLAFAAPNVFSLVQARTLSNEGSLLRNQLTYAQQIAVSKNADVEIRFFKWLDESSGQEKPIFSAFQLFQYGRNGEMEPISAFFRIKPPTTISEQFSTLLQPGFQGSATDRKYGFESPTKGRSSTPRGVGGGMVDTEYISFRFRADGSTDLPNRSSGKDTWYVTLVQGEGAAQTSSLPQNYVTLQVNPYNGVVTQFRPDI